MNDSFDRLRNRATMTDAVTLALDPNDAQRLADARSRVRRAESAQARADAAAARENASRDAYAAAEEAAADHEAAVTALAELEASLVTFTVHLKAVGPRRIEELMLEHRPTKAQCAAARSKANGDPNSDPEFDEDKFPPALLAEAIERIEFSDDGADIESLSVSQATDLWTSPWPQGDRIMVLQTAMMLNQVSSSVGDLGKG